ENSERNMNNSLEERLKSNSSAFEGLLSLIPAKYYYDEKTQEQWKAKKKSKGQLKEDKKAKLDPEQQNEESGSALDVLKKKQASAKPVVLPGQRKMSIEEE
ncbi:66S pre-ribosomal particles component, partial [Kluyveromyces marxianus]